MHTLVRCLRYGGSGQNSNLLISHYEFDSVFKRRYHHKWGQTAPLQTLTSATGEFTAQNYVTAYLSKRIKNCFWTAKLFHTILDATNYSIIVNIVRACGLDRIASSCLLLICLFHCLNAGGGIIASKTSFYLFFIFFI